MPDDNLYNVHADGEALQPRMYSPNLQPLLQSLLATLADIDFAYEREREKLSNSSEDTALKKRVLEKIRQQHRERREPYIQQLTVLQQHICPVPAQSKHHD